MDNLIRSNGFTLRMNVAVLRLFATCIIFAAFLTGVAIASTQTGEKALNHIDPGKMEQIRTQVKGDLLPDGQVRDAITSGSLDSNKSGDNIGLKLEDSGQKWASAVNKNNTTHSGFAVRMLTPRSWIAWNAHEAKRSYKPYTITDVTEWDRLPVLRVIVKPDTPDYVVAGAGMRASSSVEHVVLRSEDKRDVIQPISIEPYEVESKNAMGGSKSYNGVVAIFSMVDLTKLRTSNENSEFFVTVVGEKGKERNFKVKQKHFFRLD